MYVFPNLKYIIAHSLTVYEYLRASDSREICNCVKIPGCLRELALVRPGHRSRNDG